MLTKKLRKSICALLLCCAISILASAPLFAFQMDLQNDRNPDQRQNVRAPELKGDVGWLNTEKPLSMANLKGKIVLLDFWTYGCVNCIHIIPDLKKLEEKYADQLVVIGVHSAKFENEKNTDNIRQIILRYGIEHPVVNDANFKIWDSYAVRAWPTQVLIDPQGYVVKTVSGEGNYETLDRSIGDMISTFRKNGRLDETPLKFALERAKIGDLPLAFPGKVLADAKSKRLFIADSNHNRIVVTDFEGKLVDTIGSGEATQKDGDYMEAGFNSPQGMALDGDDLYVADTENHLIRRINLQAKLVETIGGTGTLEGFNGFGGKPLETALRSPWDLSLVGKELYIAMAGSHQIWRMDLERNYIEPYAGSRWEARTDGNIKDAAFAQPSGIVSDGKNLFVADSESNIIREIDLQKKTVETLVGGDLFSFGDRDGRGDNVRLQHPLGVELFNGKVFLADTYNHKIKTLDPEKRTVETFIGTGKSGQIDGTRASFYEPGGISVADDQLFVADTNNHAVRIVNLKTRDVTTLKIIGLTPPKELQADSVSPNLKEIDVAARKIPVGKNTLLFDVELPDGFHLNLSAPQRFEVSFGNEDITFEKPQTKFSKLPIIVPFQTKKTGKAIVKSTMRIYYCREDNTGVCYIKTFVWKMPVEFVSAGGDSKTVELRTKVE